MITVTDIISALEDTRYQTLDMVRQLDLEDIVYANSGWRVHDIITHLTWSDEHAGNLIQAFLSDKWYALPEHLVVRSRSDVHRRNAWIRRQRYMKNPQEVMTELIEAHENLKRMIATVGTSQLHDEFTAHWGERITAHTLAIWQIQHDQHHRRDLGQLLGLNEIVDNRVYHLVYSEV